jgi:hypothetical protein
MPALHIVYRIGPALTVSETTTRKVNPKRGSLACGQGKEMRSFGFEGRKKREKTKGQGKEKSLGGEKERDRLMRQKPASAGVNCSSCGKRRELLRPKCPRCCQQGDKSTLD